MSTNNSKSNISIIDIQDLSLDPANLRIHTDRNKDAVNRSLRAFGAARSIVVDGKGVVRAGNQTLESAKKAGVSKVVVIEADGDMLIAVRRPDWSATEAVAYAIADNRAAELAEWDEDNLALVLESIRKDETTDHVCTGFIDEEINELVQRISTPLDGLDEGDIPLPPDEAVTQPGELCVMGNHRLLCGDSSSSPDLDRLLDGAIVDLVNMDPPYNVKVEPRSNNAIAAGLSNFSNTHHQGFDVNRHPEKAHGTHKKMRAKDRPLANDFLTDGAFDEMLLAWFGNATRVLKPGGSFYIWGGYANLGNYPEPLKTCGLYFSQAIVWDKQHPVLTRKDFMGAFEICFYGWKTGAGHHFYGPNNATDLWHVKKVNPQSMIHLTEKPVELAIQAIQYSSKPNENVLDLFGGSGSTLVGCEKTGRHAFLMEIDALYCDVIIQRWETLTGGKVQRHRAAN